MIIVKLMGGLGNQLFQFATGLSLATKHNTKLLIDIGFLNKNANGQYTKRNLELNYFNLPLVVATNKDLKPFLNNQSNKVTRMFQRTFPFLFSHLYISEYGIAYNTQFNNFPKNTYLDGFWQSEKYFSSIKSILIENLSPKQEINPENKQWIYLMQQSQSVSLHIRRGDYITNKGALEHHGICGIDYYKKAINYLKQKKIEIELFVFSDDLNWCKKNLNFDFETHFVDTNQTENFYMDLVLMSNCKHNIIANSSFSWWAAWLNSNSNKIVIAPKHWFAAKALNSTDLIPNDWIKI